MENLYIEPTAGTPQVDFKMNGELNMEGRSLPEDAAKFYKPIVEWLETYSCEETTFNFRLEYLNTSSSKQILNVIKSVEKKDSNKNIVVNWYYEEGDIDGLETGEHFATIMKDIPFNFIEYAETEF
jgi:hypothetical protein